MRNGSPVLIVGAGDAGVMMVSEMLCNPQLKLSPVGFVDDDPVKHGLMIRGLRVLGGRKEIPQLVAEYESSGLSRIDFCRERGVALSTLGRYRRRERQAPSGSSLGRCADARSCARSAIPRRQG